MSKVMEETEEGWSKVCSARSQEVRGVRWVERGEMGGRGGTGEMGEMD